MYGAAAWTLRFFPIKHDSGPSQNINGTKRMRESSVAKTIARECTGRTPHQTRHQTRHQTPPPSRRCDSPSNPTSLAEVDSGRCPSIRPRSTAKNNKPIRLSCRSSGVTSVAAESFRRSRHQPPPPSRRWIRASAPASALNRRQKQQANPVSCRPAGSKA